MGYFSAKVVPVQIKLSDNFYNVVFEVDEGKKAKIEKIIIKGNKFLKDEDILSAIKTKEYKWWKFFSRNDVFDEDRAKSDVALIKKYYRDNGFMDATVIPSNVNVSEDKGSFILTFEIEEGDRYKVGDVKIASDVIDYDLYSLLKEENLNPKGSWFSLSNRNKTEKNLSLALEEKGFIFKEINVDVKKVEFADEPIMDIIYNIENAKKIFVDKINILGNTVTRDSVIRNELYIGEQDVLTQTKLRMSKSSLSKTGYFDNLSITPSPTLNPEKVNLDVAVVERNTGEISFALGWSSLKGLVIDLAYKESNFMGKGHKVSAIASRSSLTDNYSFSYTDPYFFNKNMSGGFTVFMNNYKYKEDYGYDKDSYGLALNTGWKYNKHLSQSDSVRYQMDDVSDLSDDSTLKPEDVGEAKLYIVSQKLSYRDTDYDLLYRNRSGYILSVANSYTLKESTENYFKTDVSATYYKTFLKGRVSTSASINGGYIEALEDNYLRRSYRYFLGGSNLRGFAISGVGARQNGSSYTEGGEWRVYGSLETKFPIGIPSEYKVNGLAFFDYGAIGKPSGYDPATTQYDDSIRTAAGLGINWDSPMGSIALTWAWAQNYEEYDERETFRLSIGNNF
jgi:outer membrane protein insertion porin family